MSLPSSALTYQRQIGAEKLEALDAVNRQWSRMGTDFDAGWIRVGPQITRIVTTAQLRMAQAAADYLPSALAEVGLSSQLAGQVVPGAFAGVNGQNGLPLAEALSFSVVRAKMSVAEGAQAGLALQRGGQWLTLAAGTAMADAGRSAEAAGLAASSATGFVRMLNPPSCPRCVVLAGRWYRWNAGFDRHPGCDCRGVPASEDVAGDMTTDPYAYFESLSPAQRIRDFGASDALAIEEGADIFQVVNARRGMTAAGRFTREGTTRRGYFRSGTEAGRAGRRRLSVQEIVRRSGGDRAAARELLRRYGYITEQGQNPHGVIRMGAGSSSGGIRWVATGAGGTRRPTPPTAPGAATSGAGGGAKPPRPPRAGATAPGPDPKRGKITFPDDPKSMPQRHEVETAMVLAANGMNVKFREVVHGREVKNPDVEVDGTIWEFKAPTGEGQHTISNQFRRARSQADRMVLDTRRTRLPDSEIRAEAQRRLNRDRRLVEVILVTKSNTLERLRKSA